MSTSRNGVTGSNLAAFVVGDVSGVFSGITSRGAPRSTVNDHVTLPEFVLTVTVYVPSTSTSRGITTTALSPSRIARAVASADVLPACSAQVGTGPFGPVIVAFADVTSSGIIAIRGSPALPVQPHNVMGFGNSVMKLCRGTVAPSPGKTIGVEGRARE